MIGSAMSDVAHWISRYWKVLVVLGGIVFWAGRLDMKVESLDDKVDRVIEKVDQLTGKVDRLSGFQLGVDDAEQGSTIAQGSGATGEAPDAR